MPIVWSDLMNDTDELLLTSHTPDGGGGAWVLITGTGTTRPKIDTARYTEGISSCRFSQSAGATQNNYRHNFTAQNANTFYFSWNTEGLDADHFSMPALGQTNMGKYGPIVYIKNLALEYYDGTTAYSASKSITADTWYDNKIVFDSTAKTFTWYIKGGTEYADWTEVCAGKSFYHTASWGTADIAAMWLRGFINDAGAPAFDTWYDDVRIGETDSIAILRRRMEGG